jgi:excisionase family DNA binding protein
MFADRSSWLTAKDLARSFQVSVRTIRRWCRQGRLPAPVRISGTVRWNPTVVQEWLDNGTLASNSNCTRTPIEE